MSKSTSSIVAGQTAPRATLEPTPFGSYQFDHDGTSITHPARSSCGRFWVEPSEYGFEVWETGGGCTAWRRDFVLENGTPVYMMVTVADDPSHELVEGQPICIGVYLDDDNGGGDDFVVWTQDDGCADDCPPRNFFRSGRFAIDQNRAAINFVPDPTAPTMVIATLGTRNYDFECVGTSESEARGGLLVGLATHARQYKLAADWFNPDNIEVREVRIGCATRDREQLPL